MEDNPKTKTQPIDPYGGQIGIALSADTVAAQMDRLVEDGVITSADKALMMWFFAEVKDKTLTTADAGKAIGYDASTVSRILRGRYDGNWGNVLKAVRRHKLLVTERAKMVRADFVDTSIFKAIRDTCDLALFNELPATIIGVSQIGKTSALEEYQRRSEFMVRLVRMPAAPGLRGAMEAVADACNVTTRCTSEQLRRRVADSLDNKTLLIVDEFHQLAISSGRESAMKIAEWIRELHDRSKCGLVLCGTKALKQDLIDGPLKAWLDQLKQRCIKHLVLPDRLPDEDILLVAKNYRLAEPDAETLAALRTLRMNRLCKILMLADNLARKRDQPLDWKHFHAAYRMVGD